MIIKETEGKSNEKVKEYVSGLIKDAKLLDESAGSLLYSIGFNNTEQITLFLQDYEENKEIRELIEDISISNSTLEEVFINVTRDTTDTEAQEEEEAALRRD